MKISIIIPVYNKIRYLAGLLEQVREQSFRDFECLLIDDGSTDGSGAVCDEFARRDSRFRVFHIPNGGVSHARNVGLDTAQGEYVTFLDADDQIHPNFLENLLSCAEESGAAFVIGNLQKVWDDGREPAMLALPYQGLYPFETLLPDFARIQQTTGIYGFCAPKLIRRELTVGIRFDSQIKLAEDLSFYLDIYPRVNSVYFDQKPYYYYLQAAENSSMLNADEKIDYFTQLNIQRKIADFLQEKGAFSEENYLIMVNRMYDYVYFCIFHCKICEVPALCARIRALDLPERISGKGDPLFRKGLLFLFEKKLDVLIQFFLGVYRAARCGSHILQRKKAHHVDQTNA